MNQELRTIPELLDYLQVLRRRAFIILVAAIIVPLVATFLVSRQPALYRASADVLLNRQDIAASLTNVTDPTLYDATRNAQTQAEVARVPEIATRVVEELDLEDRTPFDFLGQSSVSASEDADVLTFLATDANPKLTPRLATEYARQFTIYRSELDTRELKGAREAAQSRLERMKLDGRENSAPYANLEDVVEKLRTLETLYRSRAILIRPAVDAVQIQPKVFRATMIGGVLGIVLGLLFAFLAEALDTRVRSADSLSTKLGLPLLARIPEPPRSVRRNDRLVMMTMPNDRRAEPYRMLRTNLDFVILEVQPRTIAVTSAVAGEGKSTTAANLAVSLARTGRRVLVADFDVRAPSLDRFFNLRGRPGLTNVVLGEADLSDAIAQIALPHSARRDKRDARGVRAVGNAQSENGSSRTTDQALAADLPGVLDVLPTGPVPPNPGEFLTSHRVTAIVDEVRTKYDVILIDAAPLLLASETLALLGILDAFLLVARLDRLRSGMLVDLQRILHTCPAPALGFVLTAAKLEAGYSAYGDYSTADIDSDVAVTTEFSEDEMSQGRRGTGLLSRWARSQR
jgi:succinoglycan biosynthesis transport protein ExoP